HRNVIFTQPAGAAVVPGAIFRCPIAVDAGYGDAEPTRVLGKCNIAIAGLDSGECRVIVSGAAAQLDTLGVGTADLDYRRRNSSRVDCSPRIDLTIQRGPLGVVAEALYHAVHAR